MKYNVNTALILNFATFVEMKTDGVVKKMKTIVDLNEEGMLKKYSVFSESDSLLSEMLIE